MDLGCAFVLARDLALFSSVPSWCSKASDRQLLHCVFEEGHRRGQRSRSSSPNKLQFQSIVVCFSLVFACLATCTFSQVFDV